MHCFLYFLVLIGTSSLYANTTPVVKYGVLTDAEKETVALILDQAKALETYHEKLSVLGAAAEEYQEEGNFQIVAGIYKAVFSLRNRQYDGAKGNEDFESFYANLDLTKFNVEEANHLRYLHARFLSLSGAINDAEAELLALLSLDEGLGIYTRSKVHLSASYCSYFTDQLARSAYHSRMSATLSVAIGEMTVAAIGFDGASASFLVLGKVDSALFYARRGLRYAKEATNNIGDNLCLNYAEALMESGQQDSAFYYAEKGRKAIEKRENPPEIARAAYCLGNLNTKATNHKEALSHYEIAFKNFGLSQEIYWQVDVIDSMAVNFEKLGNIHKAYAFAKRGFTLRDSLREERTKQDADKLVATYERDVLAKELAAAKGEKALVQANLLKRNYERIALALAAGFLFLLVVFINYRARSRKRLTVDLQHQVEKRTSELQQHSLKLEEQAVRLKESNQELERFAYIASHDLKTPIRNVTSFLGLIKRRLPVEAKALVAEYLDIALDNAHRMNTLVTDVLEFSRLNSAETEDSKNVSVKEVTEEVIRTMRAELDEKSAVVTCEGDTTILLPKGVLEQILSNLIGNAIKYNKAVYPEVKIITSDMGDRIRISIADNGIGIAPEYHERIFEVFRRLHTVDEYAGTGVGLAACRKVITRLQGEITVDSEVGKGSIFTIDLPVQEAKKIQSMTVKETTTS